MARHRRSPTCRYCYGIGHTQRTCPQVKTDAKIGKLWAKDIVERNQQSAANRTCGYCTGLKHTARTCPQKANDYAVVEKFTAEWKKYVKDDLAKKGCAVGTLYRYKPYRYDHTGDSFVCYVERIEYKDNMPTNTWIQKTKCDEWGRPKDQTVSAELEQYNRFRNRSKDKAMKKKDYGCYVHFHSVSGTGLGYWGDCERDHVSTDDFLHDFSSSSSKDRFTVVG